MKRTYVKPEVLEHQDITFETTISGTEPGTGKGCCCGDPMCPCNCWNEGNHPTNGTNHQHDNKCIHHDKFPNCARVKGDSSTVEDGFKGQN
ncbi:MAG: hypothetical protein ACI35O_08200 [Bacillaceae bacterium]